jgi:predicted aspartyl protease
METETVGKVVVPAKIENLYELMKVSEGLASEADVHRLDVPDARVDTGATFLSMPTSLIRQLGLRLIEEKHARTATGMCSLGIYGPARLRVQDRTCDVRVSEVAEGCPVLIGFIPLEMLDFVVDSKNQRLIGNPDHGGEQMIDMYHQTFQH